VSIPFVHDPFLNTPLFREIKYSAVWLLRYALNNISYSYVSKLKSSMLFILIYLFVK